VRAATTRHRHALYDKGVGIDRFAVGLSLDRMTEPLPQAATAEERITARSLPPARLTRTCSTGQAIPSLFPSNAELWA
jgi:hypothetical protein